MNKFTITLDSGNSCTKCCLFGENQDILTTFSLEKMKSTIKNYGLDSSNTEVILASVSDASIDIPFKYTDVKSIFLENKFLDMPVHYTQTLGIDRLVAAYYIFKENNYPKVVIDAGTFTTVDYVDIKGFNGGFILPGLNLLSDAYGHGERLFEATTTPPENLEQVLSQFPQSTETAIDHGAFLSFLSPIKEVLRTHQFQNIILTGGFGEILRNYLENWEFCQDASIQFDKYLVHKGLYRTLQENNK